MNLLKRNCKVSEAKDIAIGDSILTERGYVRVKSIKYAGKKECYDISLLTHKDLFNDEENFILGNGIISHNCNLTVIDDCVKLIEKTKGFRLSRNEIPINDNEAIKFGSQADLVGIFQLESPATKPLADEMGLDSIDEISICTSLLRPGPRGMQMHTEFALRKHGKKYAIPKCLEPVLGSSRGILVFQEQAMQATQAIAGFSPIEANKFRSAISKKKKDEIPKLKEKYLKGAQKKIDTGEISTEEVNAMWDLMENFCSYAFNKSHAVSYSAVTAVELYLKYRFRTEYMTALINNTAQNQKKHGSDNMLVKYINYCRSNDIKMLPPDINQSEVQFSIPEDKTIRYALGHIRMVGKCSSEIVGPALRANDVGVETFITLRPYADFEDFFAKSNKRKVNSKVIKNLIYAGAFDEFGKALCIKNGAEEHRVSTADKRNIIQEEYHRIRYRIKTEPKVEKPKKLAPIFEEKDYLKKGKKLTEFTVDGFNKEIFSVSIEDFYTRTDRRFFSKNIIKKMIFAGLLDHLGVKLLQDSDVQTITAIRNAIFAEITRLEQIPKPRKKKEIPPPERLTLEQYWDMEKEVLGLCLSRKALLHSYAKVCKDQDWATIEQADTRDDCYVFGRVEQIQACKSKAGKNMRRVTISDDINEMMFFVFDGAINQFQNKVKLKHVYAIPTRHFDDSKQRFFFDRKDAIPVDANFLRRNNIIL